MIGKTIGHYKIRERFVRDQRELYLAEDTRFGRKVVVKFYAEIADRSRAREAFKGEAIVASLVDHPNIRAVYAVDEFEGAPFIVMEHMEGVPLERELEKGPLELQRILEVGSQVADALEAIHSQGIIHGNIKPTNIFLTVAGQTKLCDFAHATTVGAEEAEEKARRVVGTIAGFSPEQLMSEPVGTSTDIFTFGMVMPYQRRDTVVDRDPAAQKEDADCGHQRPHVSLRSVTVGMILVSLSRGEHDANQQRDGNGHGQCDGYRKIARRAIGIGQRWRRRFAPPSPGANS